MKALLRRYMPRAVWQLLSGAKNRVLDTRDAVLGRSDPLLPPRHLMFVGEGDFRQIGQEFLGHFTRLCALQPDARVLEAGCGIGRMAIPLTGYLSSNGSYEGFDVVPAGIEWCTSHVTTRFPNFRFQIADVKNQEYNPHGRVPSSEYRFPHADASFDFVFLTSVFTHMLPAEVEQYLSEIRRVLKPGGRCLISWFLRNDASSANRPTHPALDFRYSVGECFTTNPSTPEEAICYPEAFVFALYARLGFELRLPVSYGSWSGRQDFLSFQDICVARKPN